MQPMVRACTYTEEEVDAALCLWEECLNRMVDWKREHGPYGESGPPLFDWLRGGEGCACARSMCAYLSTDIEVSYQYAREFGFDDSFDWEFVPRWADYAMELTETHLITPTWYKWLGYKVTQDWKESYNVT